MSVWTSISFTIIVAFASLLSYVVGRAQGWDEGHREGVLQTYKYFNRLLKSYIDSFEEAYHTGNTGTRTSMEYAKSTMVLIMTLGVRLAWGRRVRRRK